MMHQNLSSVCDILIVSVSVFTGKMFSKRLTSKIFGLACTASLFAPGAALPAATRIAHHAKQVCLPKSTFVTYAPYTHASKGYREERRVSIFPSTADTSDAANAISPWHGISLVACPVRLFCCSSSFHFRYLRELAFNPFICLV